MSGFTGFLLVLLANAALLESILTRCNNAREVSPRPNIDLEPAARNYRTCAAAQAARYER